MATITRTTDRDREQLRRSAGSLTQGPSDEEQSHSYPRREQLQFLGDPQDPTRVSFPFLRRMRRDHMVAMGLHFVAMPIVRAPWYIEADDAKAAALADNLIRPIYGPLILTLLRMLSFGYSPAVKNFETIQPTWKYLPGVGQDPQLVWDQGGVEALVYKPVTPLRPETARPVWDAKGNFNGISYDNRYGNVGYFLIEGQQKPNIDLLHSVWATHNKEDEDGSPWGFARIAYCAPIFHMYRFIWTMLGRAFENNADPGAVVRYPRDDLPTRDAQGNAQNNVDVALRIGRRRRSGSTIAMPSDPYVDYQDKPTGIKKWDIEYPRNDTSFQEILKFVGFLESAKLRALFLQEQGLIEGSGGQSNRNVASEFGIQRDDSQLVLVMQLFSLIEDCFIKPSFAMNMPSYQGSITMKPVGFSSDEDDIARQLIQLAGQQQDFRTFGVDMRQILESRGMPMMSPADYKKIQQDVAKQASRLPPPAVSPVQGRRALVTQTGFDRELDQPIMSYVQLGGTIDLGTTDGDFIAGLPKTDVFANKQVLATARGLRADAKSFLSWFYGDFARYLGKQKSLDLSELEREVAREYVIETGEELATPDIVRQTVDRVLAAWKPKLERISEFSTGFRSKLGQIFDRTTSLHLDRLSSTARINSLDRDAAAWLDARGAESVQGILDTTRQQLAEALANGVRDGKTAKEIAADIRDQFTDFPEWRAATIARTETSAAYNYATIRAGMAAGLSTGQLIDGNKDQPCKQRNGRILPLADALNEKLNHPNCSLYVRLLPRAPVNLDVRYEPLDGYKARFDADTATVLLDTSADLDLTSSYLLAIGDMFAQEGPLA